MLRSIKDISRSYTLSALDGEIGEAMDFLFDDVFWNIKYLVADTGDWLHERLVLISPSALEKPDWNSRHLPVNLTKEIIEKSPPLEKHKPVSRQRESELIRYYSWPVHFSYGIDVSYFAEMQHMAERLKKAQETEVKAEEGKEDRHLRSTEEVIGYSIQATDGSIGHVEDFIFDDESWIIRYLVIDTKKWLTGRKVLISPEWVRSVDWPGNEVSVGLSVDMVKNSPEYDPSEAVNRAYEVQLYDYYGRPRYW